MPDREKVIKALKCCIGEPFCRNCPWEECEHQCDVVDNVPTGLLLSAISLLKEQEPRVMTLEEADTAPFVWLEAKNGGLGVRRIRIAPKGSSTIEIYSFVMGLSVGSAETFDTHFRCWTAKPTDEQRKAVPWG